jgi:hypothetical protein
VSQLVRLSNLENLIALFIQEKTPQVERLRSCEPVVFGHPKPLRESKGDLGA